MVFCTICVQGQYMTHRLTRAEVWDVRAAAGLMLWPDYAATAQTTYSKTDTYSNVASIHDSLPPHERIVFKAFPHTRGAQLIRCIDRQPAHSDL